MGAVFDPLARSIKQRISENTNLMEKPKFPPGPWSLNYYTGYLMRKDGDLRNVQIANAHLIAAAPEMYRKLEHLSYHMKRRGDDNEEIELLLAKARGEEK